MLRTKDGYKINVGMWLLSVDGIFEVTAIYNSEIPVTVTEILFEDPDTDEFSYGKERYLTRSECAKLCRM